MDDTEAFNDFSANTVYDLFADDDEDLFLNEEEYEQTKQSEGVDEFSRKRNIKLGPFSTDTFWKRADDRRYDLKNHLWDFMIYNSIREQSFGNYKGQVEMMNSQLMLSIAECKNNVLNSLNELDHLYKTEQSDPVPNNYYENSVDKNLDDEHKNQVEACFDKLIRVVLDKFRIKLDLATSESNDNSGFEDMASPRSDNINKQICEYLKSRKQVRQLFREFADYRRTKNQLIRKSLHELLKSFNEFRNKILKEVYQDSKGNKMNLTRFVKNMDKVTSRFDFFCEYRFHNLATYFRNKEEVDNYIDSFVAFNTFTDDFSQFNNNFNPNLKRPAPTATTTRSTTDTFVGETAQTKTSKDEPKMDKEPEQMPLEVPTEEDEMESIFSFMGGDVSQNFIQTQDQPEIQQKSDSRKSDARSGGYKDMNLVEDNDKRMEFDNHIMESKVLKDRQKEEEDDLKLLQEARKKAAEILRLKRIERMQSNQA